MVNVKSKLTNLVASERVHRCDNETDQREPLEEFGEGTIPIKWAIAVKWYVSVKREYSQNVTYC